MITRTFSIESDVGYLLVKIDQIFCLIIIDSKESTVPSVSGKRFGG